MNSKQDGALISFSIEASVVPKKNILCLKYLTPCQHTQTNHFNSSFECDPSDLPVINLEPLARENTDREFSWQGNLILMSHFKNQLHLLTHAKLTAVQRL